MTTLLVELESTPAGHALLVHPTGPPDPKALAFASHLAADPAHQLVVVDVPAGTGFAVWESVAALLSPVTRGIRMVFGRPPEMGVIAVGEWLARRCGHTVLVGNGRVEPAANGVLFLSDDDGQGWIRCEPGRAGTREGQRFPPPSWENLLADPVDVELGPGTVVASLPAGVWLRTPAPAPAIATARQRLVDDLACRTDRLAVILGTPDGTPIPVADIAAYWQTLRPAARLMARLIPYGPVAPTGSASLGQALADLLDEPVVVYDRPDWLPAADEVTYRTGRPAGVQVQPTPEPAQSAVPPPWGIDEERAWLRRTHGREFDARASSVARILSQSPGMRGDPATQSEVITDLVAVEIFLSTDTRLDDVVRAGAPGPHLPLARCVASGLQRLPTYRGVVALRSTLTDDEWAWFGQARDLTDWGFLTAHTGERRGVAGNVDFLIWSQTARRTASLRPADPGRVVFPPGSQFTVLGTRTSDNARVVLLRERSAADAVALAGLEQAVSRWLDANPVPRSPAPPGERTVGVPAPGQAPGLILGMP